MALLFVAPEAMRTGVGGALWRHMCDEAERRGAATISIDSDPNAVGFYRRMGARPAGHAPPAASTGRSLPRLVFSLR